MSEDLASEIRHAVSQSGIPLATISIDTGVEVATLKEFMDGADMHLIHAKDHQLPGIGVKAQDAH